MADIFGQIFSFCSCYFKVIIHIYIYLQQKWYISENHIVFSWKLNTFFPKLFHVSYEATSITSTTGNEKINFLQENMPGRKLTSLGFCAKCDSGFPAEDCALYVEIHLRCN